MSGFIIADHLVLALRIKRLELDKNQRFGYSIDLYYGKSYFDRLTLCSVCLEN